VERNHIINRQDGCIIELSRRKAGSRDERPYFKNERAREVFIISAGP